MRDYALRVGDVWKMSNPDFRFSGHEIYRGDR
jgi:hypothetical protein